MKYFGLGVLASIAAGAVLIVMFYFLVMPRLSWAASEQPGSFEQTLAQRVLRAWIRRNASNQVNPLPLNSDMLKSAQQEYEAHCAVCHGLDGSARNQLEADLYPPVAKLTGNVQQFTDGELYFMVAKGIRYTAMPSFEKRHSPLDIWKTVLWVRHLARLTPKESAALERQMNAERKAHETTMQGMLP